jgi:hypothetical protein
VAGEFSILQRCGAAAIRGVAERQAITFSSWGGVFRDLLYFNRMKRR